MTAAWPVTALTGLEPDPPRRSVAGFDANVIARPIASSDGILCAAPGYLRCHGIPRQPEERVVHRILRIKFAANRHRSLHLINPQGRQRELEIRVEPALLVNHSDTLIQACVEGAGIISQSIALVAKLLGTGELQRVLAPWITGRFPLYAALPSRKFIPARTSAFLEFITEHTRAEISKLETLQA